MPRLRPAGHRAARACRCSARSTTRSPSTGASRWSTPRPRYQNVSPRPAGTRSPRCRPGSPSACAASSRCRRTATTTSAAPTACRPRSCSSCPSASTPTCSAAARASSASRHQIISTASADVAMKGQRFLLEALAKLRTEYPDAEARPHRPPQGRLGGAAHHRGARPRRRRRVRLRRHRRAHRRALQRVGLRRRARRSTRASRSRRSRR